MKSIAGFCKPQYAFRPWRLLRRIAWEFGSRPAGTPKVKLPWGLPLTIDPKEKICEAIWLQGIYDLGLTEALWRLTRQADVAVDVGAHVGYTAAILSARAGPQGQVYAFEPHPDLFRAMQRNTVGWSAFPGTAQVFATNAAVSDSNERAYLVSRPDFGQNSGTSFVAESPEPCGGTVAPIRLLRLDSVFPSDLRIGVVKVDVEGHELRVFAGMGDLLKLQRIRDLVFEESKAYRAPTHQYLESLGYTVLAISTNFWGMRVHAPDRVGSNSFFPPCFIATCDPARTLVRFGARGWHSLSVRGQSREYR